MKAFNQWIIAVAALVALPAAALAQARGHIELQSVAEIEQEVINEEGKKEIKRVPAARVLPGTEVIFSQRYENVSKETAENAVITNPVPEHMIYKEGSANGAGSRITFSVDNGQSYYIPAKLFIFDSAGRKFPARAKDYTHIRWTLTKPLPSGTRGVVSFRAILK